jgi:hypothetical protein
LCVNYRGNGSLVYAMERIRLLGVGAVVIALIAAIGCGGQGGSALSATLPADLANLLAEQSEEAASQIDSGDTCEAEQTLDSLEAELEEASASGDVPDPLREQIEGALSRLKGLIDCAPQPEPQEAEPEPKSKPKPQAAPPPPTTTEPPPPPPPEQGTGGSGP